MIYIMVAAVFFFIYPLITPALAAVINVINKESDNHARENVSIHVFIYLLLGFGIIKVKGMLSNMSLGDIRIINAL